MLSGEAARLLGVSVQYLLRLDDRLQPTRAGRFRVYDRARVEQFAAERAAKKVG